VSAACSCVEHVNFRRARAKALEEAITAVHEINEMPPAITLELLAQIISNPAEFYRRVVGSTKDRVETRLRALITEVS
jgi:hypothetical protein